ncbi:hypothetical protein H0A43_00075 [Arcobacter lanthieri]|uniref:hypothetical protein n=1 Tax=Aliarcobacter lanthieri TaxID=1355374 RepID=UPI0019206DBA|nr:hypothetical protein [Aliarcobacter lanthieri]MBL3518868.1 hypothetical protein [Aliarcobacter lanthieri]
MHISNIYNLVVILIEKTEIEYFKYKGKHEDFSKIRLLKSQLSDLHELRRSIEKLHNFKQKI